jgi:hypothetical protein
MTNETLPLRIRNSRTPLRRAGANLDRDKPRCRVPERFPCRVQAAKSHGLQAGPTEAQEGWEENRGEMDCGLEDD